MNLNNSFFEEQGRYIDSVRKILKEKMNGKEPKALIRTYGCQQNVSDGEKIRGILSLMGYGFTDDEKDADFILFNTCAVREHAEDRIFGNVGALKNLKKKKPSLIIGLCGCMMEQEHVAEKIRKSFPFVNLLFGTHSLHRLPFLMYELFKKEKRVFERGVDDKTIPEGLPTRRDGKYKAFVPIMYGCDNFCSYCVVPYVRGRERSRKSEEILKEIKSLVNDGYKEITLLGQNVNSYGKNLEEKINFAELLRKISEIEGDFWIRFMTSHPKDASKELIDVMASNEKICNHLHLPFQSGNDRVLKEMNRHYDRKKYKEIISYAREKIPNILFTSDVIVGFPGETYEEFCDTISLIKEVKFSALFTFIYSKRKGTPAAKMLDPISGAEKSKWFNELLDVQKAVSEEICASMVGKELKVFVESKNKKENTLNARTEGNILVELEGEESLVGKFVKAKITDSKSWILIGKVI